MVAAGPKTYQWLLGSEMEDLENCKWLGNASRGEPEKATDFLALTVKALADLLVNRGEFFDEIGRGNTQLRRFPVAVADPPLESASKAIEGAIPKDLLSQRSGDTNSRESQRSGDTNSKESQRSGDTNSKESASSEKSKEAYCPGEFFDEQNRVKGEEGDTLLEIADLLVNQATPLESAFKAIEGAIPKDLLSQKSHYTNSKESSSSEKSKQTDYKRKGEIFLKKMGKISNIRKKLCEQQQVKIPVFSRGKKPILVIDLGKYFEGKEYLIPGPFLVVLKAAVSWSACCHNPLLPECGSYSDH